MLLALAFAALPFDLPPGWQARATTATPTAAAPPADVYYDLRPPSELRLRGSVILYAGRVSDADLDRVAGERHQARMKNRVAWGMKAEGGPPRESLRLGERRAVRWRDAVNGALLPSEQLTTCVVAAGRLACVVTTGIPESHDAAAAGAATILSSLRGK